MFKVTKRMKLYLIKFFSKQTIYDSWMSKTKKSLQLNDIMNTV